MAKIFVAVGPDMLIANDGNGNWKTGTIEDLRAKHPQCIASDPTNAAVLFCGTWANGLWRSEDSGQSWRRVGEDAIHPDVTSVAVAPSNRGSVVYAGTEPSALFRSDDGGASWRELSAMRDLPSAPTWSFPPRPETSHVRWISIGPDDSAKLYVCIEAGALVRSSDGGETWTDRVPTGPYDTHTLAIDPANPIYLYSAAGDGYLESTDGGDTWRHREEGLVHRYVWGIALNEASSDTRLISAARSPGHAHNPSMAESFIYRKVGDEPWTRPGTGLPGAKGTTRWVLGSDTSAPEIVYAASNRGVYRSEDAGLSWSSLGLEWPELYQHQTVSAVLVS